MNIDKILDKHENTIDTAFVWLEALSIVAAGFAPIVWILALAHL